MVFMLFNQLRLLLWKNFRLRKRQPLQLICELLIPLLIIFILVGVRSVQLKFRMNQCEFREKQMGSMGPIPFLRDFICTFNTTCYNKTQIDWIGNYTNNFLTFLNNISDVYGKLPQDNLTLTTLIQWGLKHPNETSKLLSSLNYISAVILPLVNAMNQIHFGNSSQKVHGINTLEDFFCGSSQNDLHIFLQNFIKLVRSKRSIQSCQIAFQHILGNSSTGTQIYQVIGPLIFGKIYYTPNSNFTRQLMNRANSTFKILDFLRLSSVEWRLHFNSWILNTMNDSKFINDVRQYCKFNFSDSTFCHIADHLLNMSNIKTVVDNISTIFSFIEDILNCTELNKFVPLHSPDNIDNLSNGNLDDIFAGVVFQDDFQYLTYHNATFLKYEIRMPTNRIDTTIKFKVLDKFWTPSPRRNTLTDFKYYTSGFLLLQEAIDHAFIELVTKNISVNVGSSMQIMPYPCYVKDKFIQFLSNLMPFLLIIAWAPSVTNIIKSIVYEKENRLKEFMQVMGLSNFVHWLGWFVSTIVILICPILIMTIILKFNKILEFSSPGVVLILLLSFAISFICQAFMISTFFDKANIASVSGGIIYFILYMPFLVFVNLQDALTVEMYYAGGLLSQVSFCNAVNFIAFWEQSMDGVQFSNLFHSSIIDLNFGVGHCMVMMWVDSFIYTIIAWYVEVVFPGRYGVPRPWYFLFTKNYWYSNLMKYNSSNVYPVLTKEEMLNKHFENEPNNLKIGISIQNLVKTYPKMTIPAVNDLSLNFYQSQITAFLGHNGAGKTTTISILTGIFSPTSGTAFILDNDIRFNMDIIRQNMGLCPQHNILFSCLTVADHIYFYGLLKGIDKESIKEMLPKIVEDVGLTKKINTPSKNLSGGMKRKLSVAMAFIGNSRVVFLDEPTAGVDPFSRRSIWDLLIKYRDIDRTIILTTHHMDEADYLSDRIAIISQGKLQCCGSSMFLKKTFGEGYFLVLVKNQKCQNEDYQENGYSISGENILKFIQNHISDSKILEETQTQWTIVLPQSVLNCAKFALLFEELDKNMLELNIANYGLSDTSLEEVFLTVAKDPSGVSYNSKKITSENLDSLTDDGNLPRPASLLSLRNKSNYSKIEDLLTIPFQLNNTCKLIKGYSLFIQQMTGLQIKRFHYSKRNVKGFIAELLLPIVMILIMIALLQISSPLNNQPSMVIIPWLMMPKSRIVNMNTFYRRENITNTLIELLETGYRSNLGESGLRCMNQSVYQLQDYPCYHSNDNNKWTSNPSSHIPLISPECDCNKTGYQTCSNPLSGGPPNSYRIMPSSDNLANLTGYNISDYLMKNFKKFIRKQYGGFQFLLPSNFGQSSRFIGESTIWNGICGLINSSKVIENLNFINYLKEFFILSGTKTNFTRIWVNSKGYVSMPAYTNIFSNLLLRSRINSSSIAKNYGISVANYPLKYTKSDLLDQLNKQMFLEVSLAIFVIFGLSFIPASFVIFLIEERVSGSKRQQFVSGVNPYIYWLSNYLWDIVKYVIPVLIVIIIFVSFNYQSYIGSKNCGAFVILLIFYGFAIIPHMYPFSFFIATPSTAFVILGAYNLLVGSITTISTFFLDLLQADDPTLKPINDVLKKIFLLFPQYDLGRGMMDLSFNYMKNNISAGQMPYDSFDWNTTGEKLFSLIVLFFGWWIVIIIIESGIINRSLCGKLKNYKLKNKEILYEEDPDVANERQRIKSSQFNEDILTVIDLTKIYNPSLNLSNKCCKKAIKDNLLSEKRKLAVNNICFGVKEGECFGLLGVNGAGKTTTFKLLTGEENITHGNAFINGNSVISDIIGAHKNMGFCPQFDALHYLLNCEEELYFYCRIRGIEASKISYVVEQSLKNLSLLPHAKKTTDTLSGGNKRKLSTAIALIGYPKVLVLDEPTSGMDAGARRFLWNIIQKVTHEYKIAVILTSHNMEECEVLCNRLSIMINGEMKCIGSVQHLKSKFGDDYYVKMRMNHDKDDRQQVKLLVENEFPCGVSLKDENFITLQYRFNSTFKLCTIFKFFESLRSKEIIVDYSVSQTTLDEVFINFAKEENVSNQFTKRNTQLINKGHVNESFEKTSNYSGNIA